MAKTAAFLTLDWSWGTKPLQPNGCAWYRCKLPMIELQNSHEWVCGMGFPGISEKHGLGLLVGEDKAVHGFDLVVLKLIMHKAVADFMPKAKEIGQKIVVDIDDWFDGLDPANRAYEATDPKKNPNVNRDEYARIILQADAVITSTPFLLDYYSKKRNNVYMVRNGIDLNRWRTRKDRSRGRPTIGWVGATPWRSKDLEQLNGFIGKFIQKNKLKFHHSGHTHDAPYAHEQLKIDPTYCTLSHLVPIESYPSLFQSIDIGIIPLNDVKFNHAKSFIKGLEYAAAGVPFVSSYSPEYQYLADMGIGRVARNRDEWEYHLGELIDPEIRITEAKMNREKLANFTVSARGAEWDKVLGEVSGL